MPLFMAIVVTIAINLDQQIDEALDYLGYPRVISTNVATSSGQW